MNEKARKLVSRLHRLEGQVRAMERVLASGDSDQILAQFDAITAAAKSSTLEYASIVIEDETVSVAEKQQLLRRLLPKH